jgi:mannosyltransferase OCH1-like enzyme
MSIPKIIIQSWKTKDIDKEFRSIRGHKVNLSHWTKELRDNNPDFEYKFFDDGEVVEFIKTNYPEYLDLFNELGHGMNWDFFRYLAIYKYGGFYFDIDMEINCSLSSLTEGHTAIFPKEWEDSGLSILKEQNLLFLVGQYAFAATPKHPFIKQIIDNIIDPVFEADTWRDFEAQCGRGTKNFFRTGPVLVSQSYITYLKSANPEITILEPTPQFDSQQFGNYGAHWAIGSWK